MEYLLEATGENTKSKALDRAVEFYLQMRGDTAVVPNGAFVGLMEKAERQGSVTPEEIAEVLDTDELPVNVRFSWSVGE
ncbi:hypothetical protein HAL_39490 [Haladaptatus sp. T7]|nr:hypothetical protein HAL_39490 [Haladaptatus sp. T7]